MRQFLLLGLAFTIFVSVVSAGTTYGMIQAFGGGPGGQQGATGPQGEQGASGPAGQQGAAGASSTQGDTTTLEALVRISDAVATNWISANNPAGPSNSATQM